MTEPKLVVLTVLKVHRESVSLFRVGPPSPQPPILRGCLLRLRKRYIFNGLLFRNPHLTIQFRANDAKGLMKKVTRPKVHRVPGRKDSDWQMHDEPVSCPQVCLFPC